VVCHDLLDVALGEIGARGFRKLDVEMIAGYCPHFNSMTTRAWEKTALQARLEELELQTAAFNVGEGLLGVLAGRDRRWRSFSSHSNKPGQLGSYTITIHRRKS